jgi:hypothetical protein
MGASQKNKQRDKVNQDLISKGFQPISADADLRFSDQSRFKEQSAGKFGGVVVTDPQGNPFVPTRSADSPAGDIGSILGGRDPVEAVRGPATPTPSVPTVPAEKPSEPGFEGKSPDEVALDKARRRRSRRGSVRTSPGGLGSAPTGGTILGG